MKITNVAPTDIDTLIELLNAGTQYQKAVGGKEWQGFDKSLIETDIREKRAWKIVEDNTIVCIFAITFNDPHIWQEKDSTDAIYIHRIAVHPAYHGKGYVKNIAAWAKEYAGSLNKTLVRMDTTAGNDKLNQYYVSCGFNHLGSVPVAANKELPAHYAGGFSSLFEMEVGSSQASIG